MYEVACPHCGTHLGFEERTIGHKVRCVRCQEKFTVPKSVRPKGPTWLAYLSWCGGLLTLLGLVLSVWLGWQWALVSVAAVLFGIIGGSPRTRRQINQWIAWLENMRQSHSTIPKEKLLTFISRRTVDILPSGVPGSPSHKSTTIAEKTQRKREELVEIQGPAQTALADSAHRTARATLVQANPSVVSRESTVNPLPIGPVAEKSQREASPQLRQPAGQPQRPFAGIEFFGPDQVVTLDRAELHSPLVYAVAGTVGQTFDPSLIEFGLPVARPGLLPGQDPTDWPSYRLFNSAQRAFYLDWLAGGRRQPRCPQPYISLYAQGLERRVLVDNLDHQAIARELMGLSDSYGAIFGYRRDLMTLMWLTIQLSCDSVPVARDVVDAAISQTTDWNESQFRYCLATFAQQGWPVPAELARTMIVNNPAAVSSVVHERHAEKFNALFEKRLQEAFPDGLRFELSGRAEKLDYLFLNPTLTRLPKSETQLQARQRVAEESPQFQTLLTLWGRCTNELKSYDRAHRAADNGALTSEMWEALPEISREAEHPEAEAWKSAIQQGLAQHGRPLVRIEQLAAIKKFEQRGRLTKKQTEQLLVTAHYLRLAIEPDATMLGRNYAWDETVAVFPRRDDTPEDLATYNAASILLRLGINIAAADGQFEEQELLRITSHLSQQFALTATASERLEHLRFALVHSPTTLGTLEKSLQEKLTLPQRQVVGEFLVGVAAADGTISPEELKALKKAWQALGLDPKTLQVLLRGPEPQLAESATPVAPNNEPIVLNQELIAQIMQDTQRVAEMLRSAMGDDEEELEADRPVAEQTKATITNFIEGTQVNSPAVKVESKETERVEPGSEVHEIEHQSPVASNLWSELQPRYHPFLRELLTQSKWDRKKVDQIARSQGLMLGGAIEAINELVYEMAGDWLIIEDGDEIQVQSEILKN